MGSSAYQVRASTCKPIEHIDFTHPYTESLRNDLFAASVEADIELVSNACYAATQGPRLETAAEVQKIKRDGGDIIGMTGMPEASLAREAGIDYASICLVSNLAAGIGSNELNIEQIIQNVHAATEKVTRLLQSFVNLKP